jgi:multicomponent Na+:H+ antiporter subunit E
MWHAGAMAPRVAIAPDLVTYHLRLPAQGPSRVMFVTVLSLLPGTMAADLDGDVVRVHVLTHPVEAGSLQQLERRIAGIFGHRLAEGDSHE